VEIINEFMAEWDGLLSQNHGITVMAATNRPYALDDAVLRRLPRRILIDLPDAAARMKILSLLLKDDVVSVPLKDIALRCENYSGSDLKNMCMAAAMRALRRVRTNDLAMRTDGASAEPINETSAEMIDGASMKISNSTSMETTDTTTTNASSMEITSSDFEGAMADVPASISDRMVTVHELRHWDTIYGEGRVKKSAVQFGFSCT
jgi:SpoVK/Ycf46/Vps4 family AAA+-type ATPase